MAQLQTITKNHGHSVGNVTSEFSTKIGVKYCRNCGEECSIGNDVCKCGKKNFLGNIDDKNVNEIIGGYISLAKNGMLKSFFDKSRKNSNVKMNKKRMIQQLLWHRNRIVLDKEVIDKIYNKNAIL